eukprot:5817819-Pleurochrysis_carterae.AAC.1
MARSATSMLEDRGGITGADVPVGTKGPQVRTSSPMPNTNDLLPLGKLGARPGTYARKTLIPETSPSACTCRGKFLQELSSRQSPHATQARPAAR